MSTFEKYMQSLSYDTLGVYEVYTLNGTRIRGKIAYLGNRMLPFDIYYKYKKIQKMENDDILKMN